MSVSCLICSLPTSKHFFHISRHRKQHSTRKHEAGKTLGSTYTPSSGANWNTKSFVSNWIWNWKRPHTKRRADLLCVICPWIWATIPVTPASTSPTHPLIATRNAFPRKCWNRLNSSTSKDRPCYAELTSQKITPYCFLWVKRHKLPWATQSAHLHAESWSKCLLCCTGIGGLITPARSAPSTIGQEILD